jgi:hypothetical protein
MATTTLMTQAEKRIEVIEIVFPRELAVCSAAVLLGLS